MNRLLYLDVLRGLAILFMVLDHSQDWWMDAAGHTTSWGNFTMLVGTLAAPLFLFLVGVGLALSVAKSKQKNRGNWAIIKHLALRGLMLFLGGYILNLIVFYVGNNPQDVFAVDILQIIGLSIWFTIPFLFSPTPIILAAFILLAVLGQTAIDWHLPSWLDSFVTGQTGIDYFPLALWLPYVYLGVAFGKAFPTWKQPGRNLLILVGLALGIITLIPLINPEWGYRHPKPVFLLFSSAFISWVVAITWYWTERLGRRDYVSRALQIMGRASLMLYIFHHLVGYRVFYHLGWVTGRSWRGEYGIFTPIQASYLFLLFVILMAFISHWWVMRRPRLSVY